MISIGLSALPFPSEVPDVPEVVSGFLLEITPSHDSAVLDVSTNLTDQVFYWYISSQSQPPSESDLMNGNGASSFGSMYLSNLPTVADGPIGLQAATVYFLHYLDPSDSIIKTVVFVTSVMSTTPPILSNPSLAIVNETTVSASVTTDTDNGILSAVLTNSQTSPNVDQIEAGQDHADLSALSSSAIVVSDLGAQSIGNDFTGLSAGTDFYLYVVQRNSNGVASNVVSAGPIRPADISPPTVSSVEIVATGSSAATVTFNTDDIGGTAYVLVQLATADVPDISAVKAGIDIAIASAGPHSVDITGLEDSSDYLVYVVGTDSSGNDSDIVPSPAVASTPSATILARFFHDGDSAPGGFTNSVGSDNALAITGEPNAILWQNDGGDTGSVPVVLLVNLTYIDGVNFLRCRIKALAANGGNIWLRARTLNVSNSQSFNINITDDNTPDSERVDNELGWLSVSMTSEGNGWFLLQAALDMAGETDLVGSFQFNLGTTNGGSSVPNNNFAAFAVAVHDLTNSSE